MSLLQLNLSIREFGDCRLFRINSIDCTQGFLASVNPELSMNDLPSHSGHCNDYFTFCLFVSYFYVYPSLIAGGAGVVG